MLHIRFEYPGPRGTKSVGALCLDGMDFGDRLALEGETPDCSECLEILALEKRAALQDATNGEY